MEEEEEKNKEINSKKKLWSRGQKRKEAKGTRGSSKKGDEK
jgi:hypothetical protein